MPRPKGRQTPRPKGRPTPRPKGRPMPRPKGRPPRPKGRQTPRPKGRPMPRPKGRQTPRPKGRQTPRPKGRPMPRPKGRPMPRPKGRPMPRPKGRPMPRPKGRPMPRPKGRPMPRPKGRPAPRPKGRPTLRVQREARRGRPSHRVRRPPARKRKKGSRYNGRESADKHGGYGVMALAKELFDAYTSGSRIDVAPTAREGGCDLATAYAVEAELTQMRRAEGRTTVGRKVGAANKAVWRALKIETVLWANMYDDTVHFAENGLASASLARMRAPKLEPEVVMKLKSVPTSPDASAVLECVEWLALGYELVDNPFPDWKFKAADLAWPPSSSGHLCRQWKHSGASINWLPSRCFHAALVVGTPVPVDSGNIPALVDQLAAFTVRLSKNGELVAEGGARMYWRAPPFAWANWPRQSPRKLALSRCGLAR